MILSRPATMPYPNRTVGPYWRQSLAEGAPGIALLHIERARAGIAGWGHVHRLAVAMTRKPVHADPRTSSLFEGAPAVAYALHTAGHPAYHRALATLDRSITTLIRIRLDAAHRRIDESRLAQAREYDLINGLTGLGVYLMHRHPDHDQLREILAYLVRLTEPIHTQGETVPGWWATGSPDRRQSPRWQHGHAGFGMAHGIAGPLALLSSAMRRGISVPGQRDAIHTICAWLDQWQHDHADAAWWPEVIDRSELHASAVAIPGPQRPSWCYGTPGIARALHLAGLATGDPDRTRRAEQALIGCLTDDRQLARLTDTSLCHGWAGLIHTARCAANDAHNPDLTAAADTAAHRMRHQQHRPPADDGLLQGATGTALVNDHPAKSRSATQPRWDTCLLVT